MGQTIRKIYEPLYDIESVLPVLNKIAIFGGLNEKQLFAVFKLLKKAAYKAGEYVYQEGDAPSHIYIIREGEVRILVHNKGEAFELVSFSTGDCIGETALIGIQAHSTSALAVTDTELIVLERGALLNIFETDKELFGMLILNIARETSRRLHRSDDILAHYVFKR